MVDAGLPLAERLLERLISKGFDTTRFDLVLIQHLRADTARFARVLRDLGFSIRRLVAIEYSTEPHIVASLEQMGIHVDQPPLVSLDALAANLLLSQAKPAIVCEVGGYCASAVSLATSGCRGVIEETRRGLSRYQKLHTVDVPIIQLAVSRLKMIEAAYVGDAVARGVANILLELGIGLRNLRTAVLGVGMIGSAVAHSLRRAGSNVWCYDIDPIQMLRAVVDGIEASPRLPVLSTAKLIVGATGGTSLWAIDFQILPDGALLASASSGQAEFEVEALRATAISFRNVTPVVEEFEMPWGKRIYLLNKGFPVNFHARSLPFPVADLLFAQVASALELMFSHQPLPKGIQGLPPSQENEIAEQWLGLYHNAFTTSDR